MANNLGMDPFPDPVGHFGAPWRPFWILQAVRRCRRWASAPGGLIQTAEENRDRQVPDPDWIGNLDNPSSITGVLP